MRQASMLNFLSAHVGEFIQAVGRIKEELTENGADCGFIFSCRNDAKGECFDTDVAVLAFNQSGDRIPLVVDKALIGKRVEITASINKIHHEGQEFVCLGLIKIETKEDDYVPFYLQDTLQ